MQHAKMRMVFDRSFLRPFHVHHAFEQLLRRPGRTTGRRYRIFCLPTCLLLICAAAVAAQNEGRATKASDVERLIREIQAFSEAEPPVLSADSEITLAEVLARSLSQRKESQNILYSVAHDVSTLRNPELIGAFRVRLATIWARIDLLEALTFVNALPPRDTYIDYNSMAYDALVSAASVRDKALATTIISEALSRGAMNLHVLPKWFHKNAIDDPGQTLSAFELLLRFFPREHATDTDVLQLINCTREIAPLSRTLCSQSISLMLGAVIDKSFNERSPQNISASLKLNGKVTHTNNTKATLLTQIASLASFANDDAALKQAPVLATYGFDENAAGDTTQLRATEPAAITYTNANPVAEPKFPGREQTTTKMLSATPDKALAIVRATPSTNTLGALYLSFLNRPDISTDLRATAAAEALAAAGNMNDSVTKQTLYQLLMHYYFDAGHLREANAALDGLLSIGDRECSVDWSATATRFKWRDCLSVYSAAASYIVSEHLTDQVTTTNPSLRARLLLSSLRHSVR